MRVLNLFFVLTLICGLSSCSKDDDVTTENDMLLGDWKVTAIEYGGTSTTAVPGFDPLSVDFIGTGANMDLNISFSSSPNEYDSFGDYSINLSYELQGQAVNQTWTNQGFIQPGTWSKTDDQLTVAADGHDAQTSTILEMTDNMLKISWGLQKVTTQDYYGDVITITYDVSGIYTFEKQ